MTIGGTLRMARHLRTGQMANRLWYRARLPWFASDMYNRFRLPVKATGDTCRPAPNLWPGDGENGRRMLDGTIRLINRQHPFAVPVDWAAAGQPLLWRFSLHYFEWLADLECLGEPAAADLARAAVGDWLDTHAGPDAVAWHPYPLSLRVYAWLSHADFLLDGADAAFRDRFMAAVERQVRHLARVVERDVGGNHIIKNLKALTAAASAMDGLGTAALGGLEREVSKQILADGSHYERSPSYHLQVLCDLLDVRALPGTSPVWLEDAVSRAARALSFHRHGDGGLSLFNDGEVGSPALLDAVADHLGGLPSPPDALSDGGYFRLSAGDSLVLMDAGPCCPDDLPAHAHADMLSFEFSSGAQRIVVNSGTYAYQDAAWRNRLRGTAAHSTVTVDGKDSAEVYGIFRLGRRPRTVSGERGAGLTIEGQHDGYRHLGLIHRRRITLGGDGQSISGEDTIERTGRQARTFAARFHLHPAIEPVAAGAGTVCLRCPDGEEWVFSAPSGTVRLEDSVYAPFFYEMHPTNQIVVEDVVEESSTVLPWTFRRHHG